jgi:hypothetical protein
LFESPSTNKNRGLGSPKIIIFWFKEHLKKILKNPQQLEEHMRGLANQNYMGLASKMLIYWPIKVRDSKLKKDQKSWI